VITAPARVVREFLAWTCSPVNLAISRIVVFTLLAVVLATEPIAWYAALPDALLAPPRGMAWAVPLLPRSPQVVSALVAIALLAAAFTVIGWHTRVCAWTTTVLGLVLLMLPQIWGKVNHYHHLIWFAALIAASPSGDAWALDARERARPTNAVAYGFPLRCIGLLIGMIYFFPGLWKLHAGPDWIFSDNLRNQMWAKWMDFANFQPLFPADQWPTGWKLGAVATIAFELSFIFLILWRRTRPLALLGGVAFHLLSLAVLGINFWTLYPCYAALVDWGALVHQGTALPPVLSRETRVIAATLISAAGLAGVLRINSYPVSVYPLFSSLAVPVQETLELEFLDDSGRSIPADASIAFLRRQMGGARLTHMSERILRAKPALRHSRAEALAGVMQQVDPALREATLLRVWRVTKSTDPARHRAVLDRSLRGEIELMR
jgi:hypothetical protein